MTAASWRALLARAGYTLLFSGIGVLVPYLAGLSYAWALPIAAGLSVIKNGIATQVGDEGSMTFSTGSVESHPPPQ